MNIGKMDYRNSFAEKGIHSNELFLHTPMPSEDAN